MSIRSPSFTLSRRPRSRSVSVCSSPRRAVCVNEDVSNFVLNNDLGDEYLQSGMKVLPGIPATSSVPMANIPVAAPLNQAVVKGQVVKQADFFQDIGSLFTSFKVFAPLSFVLNIIIIIVLYYQDLDINRRINSCGTQYKKIKTSLFWLNTLASMNAAISLVISIISFNKSIVIPSGLGQIFAAILLVFNLLQSILGVQLQMYNNKDGCQTNAWLPLTWLLPMGLIIYIIFLFFQSKDLKKKGEKLFGII